ncbi:MAG TPA: sugar ABC transporter substrate-binding protein [Gemmatimonadaceae bacterium]|nr:sugar ABC transporter substrate-binding protein [Gemmatimonadaceae bacterium]
MFIRALIRVHPCTAVLFVLALALAGCGSADAAGTTTLRFWAMGAEGERVQELVKQFERENPGIKVRVQQIPWTAAHEKLLTAHVGEATPDVAQLGNTWVPEFAALDALEPLDGRVAGSTAVAREDFFPGIWATNVVDGVTYGVPWYVDTRVLFYRTDLLARAGYRRMPESWDGWVEAMRKVKALGAGGSPARSYAILLPLDEWAQPVVMGVQAGSELLRDGGRYGAFSQPEFRRGFEFYVDLFRQGLAPTVANTQVANLYQEFAAGTFALYITGPWNLGEFRNRLPAELQDKWATAPLPGPGGIERGFSNAGGASLVVFRGSAHKDAAWRLVEFLSAPERELRFYQLTGDLPPRLTAWRDSALAGDARARAFYEQLQRAHPMPPVPEWESIAARVAQAAEQVARGQRTTDDALAALDRDVNEILEKRRWMLDRRSTRVADLAP